jgi:hypothetical protein
MSGVRGPYACRHVIKTAAASSTPSGVKPAEIWPKAMLSKVAAAVAAPIKNGIEAFRTDYG